MRRPYRNLRADPRPAPAPQEDEDIETITDEVKHFRQKFKQDSEASDFARQFRQDAEHDVIYSAHEGDEDSLPVIDIKNLLGRTFITNPDDEGEQHRAKIIDALPTGDTTPDGKDAILRFKCRHGDRLFEEVLTYNKMLEWCERDVHRDDMHRIEAVIGHRPAKLKTSRSKWEVKVQWASGKLVRVLDRHPTSFLPK